jgi:crotonobetainyl-CoA:carnitine CoA-transferase CaiB-like acyl-CoA transferase
VRARVATAIAARTVADVFNVLSEAGAPASIMNRGEDLSDDPQLRTRSVLSTGNPDRPGSVFGTISNTRAPQLNEHGDRIRAEFASGD